jgi:hypothetical protein
MNGHPILETFKKPKATRTKIFDPTGISIFNLLLWLFILSEPELLLIQIHPADISDYWLLSFGNVNYFMPIIYKIK